MKKNVVAVLLTAALAGSLVLAGCGNKSNGGQETTGNTAAASESAEDTKA